MDIFKRKDKVKPDEVSEKVTLEILLSRIVELEKKFASHSHVSPTANEGAPSPYPIMRINE